MKAAKGSRLGAYVILCLMTGIRTEEARALRWDHVDLAGWSIASLAAIPRRCPHVGNSGAQRGADRTRH